MSRLMNRYTLYGFVLLTVLLQASSAAGNVYVSRSSELDQLRDEIRRVQASLEQDLGRQDRLTVELRRLDKHIAEIGTRLASLNDREKQLQNTIADLRRERAQEQQRLDQDRERLAKQLRAAYAAGSQEYLRLLLNQRDPGDVDRTIAYYQYLTQSRQDRIRSALDRLFRLRELSAQLEQDQRELAQNRQETTAQQEQLRKAREERGTLLATLERQIAEKGARLDRLLEDEEQLDKLLQGLDKAVTEIPNSYSYGEEKFSRNRGALGWPMNGSIAASFGSARGVGSLRWNGILIEPDKTAHVRAVSAGRVVFADWLRGLGLLLIIDHGEGYMSLYGHNEVLYKEPGSEVRAGEVIATVGTSGGRSTRGLYFEIRHAGDPVDPTEWLAPQRQG